MRKKICIAIMSIILAGCLMDVEYDLLFHNNSNKTIIFYPTFSGEDTIPLGTEFCIAPYTAATCVKSVVLNTSPGKSVTLVPPLLLSMP